MSNTPSDLLQVFALHPLYLSLDALSSKQICTLLEDIYLAVSKT